MNNVEKLTQIASMVDAKGLHSLAEQIDWVVQNYSPEVKGKEPLEEAVERYSNPVKTLIMVADVLDRKELVALANELDKIIELEALEQQSVIEAILGAYKKRHTLASLKPLCKIGLIDKEALLRKDNLSLEQRCPFGLSIPEGCQSAGAAIFDMEPREAEFKQNKRIFEKFKEGEKCPYAAQIMQKQGAVNCTFGTEVELREVPRLYRGSPIYPKLFEGFNTVNLDRSYYAMHDFSYYSLYSP